ncbi:MAG: tetratricopeptide repeat protein [Myxococcaceae bacterium]
MAATQKQDWKKRESFSSAIAQIVVVAVLLAGAVFFIRHRGVKREETARILKDVRATALRDNPSDLDKAISQLEELWNVDESSPDGLAVAADLYLEKWLIHRQPEAEKKAQDFVDRAKAANSRTEERYASEALLLVSEGKAQEADDFIEGLRKRGGSSARLWYAQATANHELGRLQVAKAAYNTAAEKAWKDPRFTTAAGEEFLDEGQYLQAMEAFNKALNANPDHVRAGLGLAMAQLYKRENVKNAGDMVKAVLSRSVELTPAVKARALAVTSELASFEGKYDTALKAASDAINANPQDHLAHFAKARAMAHKKAPGALDAFQQAISKRKTAPILYFEGALLWQSLGNHAGAMALLNAYETTFRDVKNVTAEGETPALTRDDRYWIARGDVLKEAGKLDEAMASYDKAIAAKNVNLVRAHYAKGSVFLARKDFDKAQETLSAITPPDGSGALAEAYLAMGETLFAKRDFAPGCQNFAFALSKFKNQQVPREKLNNILEDVNKRLIAGGQKAMAKVWMDEAKPIIQ